MAVCGAYQHTKVHTALGLPRYHKYMLARFKDHMDILTLPYPNVSPVPGLTTLPLTSPYNPAIFGYELSGSSSLLPALSLSSSLTLPCPSSALMAMSSLLSILSLLLFFPFSGLL